MGKQTSLKKDVISASEIGQYVYCSKSWYLQRCGYEPKSPFIDSGKKAHINLGLTIDGIRKEVRSSQRFAILGYLLLLITILVILFEVIL